MTGAGTSKKNDAIRPKPPPPPQAAPTPLATPQTVPTTIAANRGEKNHPSLLLEKGKVELANGNFKLALAALRKTIDETLEGSSGKSPDFGILAMRSEAFEKIGEAYEAVRDYRRAASAYLSCLAAQRFDSVVKRANTCSKIARVHGLLEMHAKAVAWYEKQLDFSHVTSTNMNEEIARAIDNHFRMGHLDEPKVTKARIIGEYLAKCAREGDESPIYSAEKAFMPTVKVLAADGNLDMEWESAPKGTDRSYLRRWPSRNGAATAPPARRKHARNLQSKTLNERHTSVRKVRKGAHFLAPTASSAASTTKKVAPKPRIPSPPPSIPTTRRVNSSAHFLKPTNATIAYAAATAQRDPPPPAEPHPRAGSTSPAHARDIRARERKL